MKRVVLPALLSLALGATALPASAQQRRGEQSRERGGEQGRAEPRQEQRPQARQEGQRGQDQREGQPRQQAPRQEQPRQAQPRQVQPRQGEPGETARGIDHGRANERGQVRENRGRGYGRVAPYRPFYYARPYYTFRPRFNLGFGLWLGYPVPYPYYGAYASPEPYDYVPEPPANAIEVEPGETYGGLSFDITPNTAEIYIDGEYAGQVGDFTPSAQPLTVGPGEHRLEIDAPGYRPMAFDVDIEPGQVIPMRGDLQPE